MKLSTAFCLASILYVGVSILFKGNHVPNRSAAHMIDKEVRK